MNVLRLLLCTDMDRTIIPNGLQSEHPKARVLFSRFCLLPEVLLTYVTGRHLALVQQAIKDYQLPRPDFVISDVGSKIYQFKDQHWHPLVEWEQEINKDWNGRNHQQIKQLFEDIDGLKLQEISKQNTHKLSYYLPMHTDHEKIILRMRMRLENENIDASLIWSTDELKEIGLLDVLPKNATKLHALEFLQHQLGFCDHEVVFAGDSGNDLTVLCSRIQSVLVANASEDVRRAAQKLTEQNDCLSTLYLAGSKKLGMGGNYSAGVLEGVWHFAPAFRDHLKQIGFST